MGAVPNRSFPALGSLSGFRLRCSRSRRHVGAHGLVGRRQAGNRAHWIRFLFVQRGIVLWSSQSPHIFGFFERVGELLCYLPHTSDNPVSERLELLRRAIKRPEAGHRVRIVEVPGVLRQPDEVTDGRVGSPGATKRRTAQLLRNAFAKKRRDVGRRVNRLDRRQA